MNTNELKQEIFPLYMNQRILREFYVEEYELISYTKASSQNPAYVTVKSFQSDEQFNLNISDCQLVLKRVSGMSIEDRKLLKQECCMEKEDLDILEGGTMHLASLQDMINITDWLRKHEYAPDEYFTNGIAVEAGK